MYPAKLDIRMRYTDLLLLATKRSIIWRTNGYKFPNLTAMGDPVGGTYHSLT